MNPVGQGGLLVDARTEFQLPDDLQFLTEAVVFDRGELDEMVRVRCIPAQPGDRRDDLGDNKRTLANNGKLANFRNRLHRKSSLLELLTNYPYFFWAMFSHWTNVDCS